ncbi:amidohydrolase family protein [Ruminococcaceae bacterium OttesenSCG-928-D13]|nr:amidohydrolase family protein [Ruminococcaceae bacterium OttesenSCG-928-D13]
MAPKTTLYKARNLIVWQGGEHRQLENGVLAVKGDKIDAVLPAVPPGAEVIDLGNAAILPGFVNLHCHPSEVFSSKSFRDDIGNPYFYNSIMYDDFPVIMGEAAGEIQAKLNLAEIIKSGVTSALIFGGPNSRLEAELAGKLGLRAWVGWGIRAGDNQEAVPIWDSPDGHNLNFTYNEPEGFHRLEEAAHFVREYQGAFSGRISTLLAPTQTMTCTPPMLVMTRKLADDLGVGITIHGSEDFVEFEMSVRMHGKTPVRMMFETGVLGEDTIIAHCCCIEGHSQVYRGGNDLELLGASRATVAHCPWVLMRIGDTLESFRRYLDAGVNIGIGTDTYPSDFIQEMRYAAAMGKLVDRDNAAVTARDVFTAGTADGAKALGRRDLGRLEKGAKADFVVVDQNNIQMAPVRDVVKNLIYCGSRHVVSQVYVDGACVMQDGQVPGVDEADLCGQLQELAEHAWKNAPAHNRERRSLDEISPLACPRAEIV